VSKMLFCVHSHPQCLEAGCLIEQNCCVFQECVKKCKAHSLHLLIEMQAEGGANGAKVPPVAGACTPNCGSQLCLLSQRSGTRKSGHRCCPSH